MEFALANIARVDIIEEKSVDPKTYTLVDVATEAEVIAYLSEGEEKFLRVKNVIKAQNNTEDIVMGYDLKLVNATMIPEVLALVDGGEYDSVGKTYTAPAIGSPVNRQLFTVKVYTEEKDINGDTTGYVAFTYLHCKGRPVDYTMQDGEFFVPEFNIRSRPQMGQPPVEFTMLETLPA